MVLCLVVGIEGCATSVADTDIGRLFTPCCHWLSALMNEFVFGCVRRRWQWGVRYFFFCIWRITQVRVCPLESNSARRRRRHRATWAEDTFINQNHYYRARIEGKQQATHSHSTLAYQANNTQTQNMVPSKPS